MDVASAVSTGTASEWLGELVAFTWPTGSGWRCMTWNELEAQVAGAGVASPGMDVRPGSVVASVAPWSATHAVADLAALRAGAVVVAVADGPRQLTSLANLGKIDFAITETAVAAGHVRAALGDVPTVVVEERTARGAVTSSGVPHPRGGLPSGPAPARCDGRLSTVLVETLGAVDPGATVCGISPMAGDRLLSLIRPDDPLQPWLHWRGLLSGATTYLCCRGVDVLGALRGSRPTFFAAHADAWTALASHLRTELTRGGSRIDSAIAVGREMAEVVGEPPLSLVSRYAAVASLLAGVRASVGLDECRLAIAAERLRPQIAGFFASVGLVVTPAPPVPDYISQVMASRGSGE